MRGSVSRWSGPDTADEGSALAGQADEQPASVIGVGEALDQSLLLQPVDEVRHS
jgi:hypothetical protein